MASSRTQRTVRYRIGWYYQRALALVRAGHAASAATLQAWAEAQAIPEDANGQLIYPNMVQE